ncbi:ion transporter [Candidatus Kapabacteria bacterium]|nr:ion transporter [Candidatus Kapabacteria bacterium]
MNLKKKIGHIIFTHESGTAKWFDIILIILIALSVLLVMLDSVISIHNKYETIISVSEWIFTVAFTIEYILRIYTVEDKKKYLFSFFGLIDFFSIIPTYISYFLPGTQYLLIIRILRVLRIFRILKLGQYIGEAKVIVDALIASQKKIFVFIIGVVTIAIIVGCMMYLVEGPENGFTSIPTSIYWSIVTLTTVGYGDISPRTPLGQFLSSVIMILGYGIIAVPTGIVTAGIAKAVKDKQIEDSPTCKTCGEEHNTIDANYCKRCGTKLLKDN